VKITSSFSRCAISLFFAIVLLAPIAALSADMPNLCGRWALIEIMPAIAELPFFNQVELTTISALLVDIAQDGLQLTMNYTYAYIDVIMDPPVVHTVVPDAFVASLNGPPHKGRLEETENGWRFIQERYIEVRGAVLDDPENDPLPTNPHDSRLVDQDGDGHPGLTVPVVAVGIVSGDTYVVHRLIYALAGSLIDNDTIRGTIDWVAEQTVVAATDPFLSMSYTYRPDPDPNVRRFIMRRVDQGWDDATLRSHLPDLIALMTP